MIRKFTNIAFEQSSKWTHSLPTGSNLKMIQFTVNWEAETVFFFLFNKLLKQSLADFLKI